MRKKAREQMEQKENKVFSVILITSVLIIAGFLIFSNWKIANKRKNFLAKINILSQQIGELEKKNQELEKGIVQIDDQDYWEVKMRERGYKKPGETMVVIKKESEEIEQEKNNTSSFWQQFFGEIKEVLR